MGRRRELDLRLRRLGETGEIMRSMKNLALMETRKLARLLDAQAESVRLIEAAAADFLGFHPRFAATPGGSRALLVVGAERGFCGDFNEELLKALGAGDTTVLAVGAKLCARLEGHRVLAAAFDGPAVAEDVAAALNQLVSAVGRLRQAGSCQSLDVLHHRSTPPGLCRKSLLPPFRGTPREPACGHPPLLNLPPDEFFAELVRQYLFAALHEIFYASLMAENQRRIQHLERAVQRLEEKSAEFSRQSRLLRQEEITEEIEVILLGAEGMAKAGGWG